MNFNFVWKSHIKTQLNQSINQDDANVDGAIEGDADDDITAEDQQLQGLCDNTVSGSRSAHRDTVMEKKILQIENWMYSKVFPRIVIYLMRERWGTLQRSVKIRSFLLVPTSTIGLQR